jgi:glycosyltransferase involved in cell wall biosynthesis
MPPNVWFITHEQHPDPRIWKFARAFAERGARVTYFWPPEPLPPDLDDCLPVPLPETQAQDIAVGAALGELEYELVQVLFQLRALLCGPEGQAGTLRDLLRRHFNNLDAYFERMRHEFSPAGQCLFFTTRKQREYCFLLKTGELWQLCPDLPKAEIAARAGFARMLADPAHNLADAFAPIRDLYPSLTVLRNNDSICAEMPNGWERGFRYRLNMRTGALTHADLPPRFTRGPDQFGATVADFGGFKETIYDYSQMLEVVRRFVTDNAPASPDLIYVADLPTLPIGVLLKRNYPGARLLVDCHEWWREQEKIWNNEGTARIIAIDAAERNLYSQCDLCLTVGEELAKAMSAELLVPFDPIYTCVFDAPPTGMSAEDRQRFRESRLGLPTGAKVALFQGSLTEKRNLEGLMRATKHLKSDQRLVVVGDGPFRNEMVDVLQSEGRPDLTVLTGWVDQSELIRFTLSAELGVIPYWAYSEYYAMSMPNKLAEYHACRLPIVASTELTEISRIVNSDEIGRCIDTRDPDQLGQTIAGVLDHSATLERWRTSYELHSERFTFDVFKKRLAEITDNLL